MNGRKIFIFRKRFNQMIVLAFIGLFTAVPLGPALAAPPNAILSEVPANVNASPAPGSAGNQKEKGVRGKRGQSEEKGAQRKKGSGAIYK